MFCRRASGSRRMQPSLLPGTGLSGSSPACSWCHDTHGQGAAHCHRNSHLTGGVTRAPSPSSRIRLSAVLLGSSVPSGHHVENRGMHLPEDHLSMAFKCGVEQGVVGGELTTEESVGFWEAALRGLERSPQFDPCFTLRSCRVPWRLELCTVHHNPRNLV